MSTLLESLLDDERRVKCRANDVAMAMGRPIIMSEPKQPVPRPSSPHSLAMHSRGERYKVALVAANEIR